MVEFNLEEAELKRYRDIVKDIRGQFKPHDIEVMVKVYRWIKSEHQPYFFLHILKRIYNYKKAVKKLRAKGLIQVVKGNDPHKITNYGAMIGGLMLLCQDLGLL